MARKYKVRKLSQYLDVPKNSGWRDKSCGIVSLVMLIKYYIPNFNKNAIIHLIGLGYNQKAYIDGVGWTHDGLIRLAKRFGFEGERFDVNSLPEEEGLKKLFKALETKPVIASIYKDSIQQNGGHLVVLTGFDSKRNLIFYNDPGAVIRDKVWQKVPFPAFQKAWKKRFIVLHLPEKFPPKIA